MNDVLLINRDDLLRYTSVNGNIDTDKILPHIKTAQDLQLEPILGTKLMEKCKDIVSGGDLDQPIYADYKTLIITYCTPMLVFFALVDFLPFHQYTIAGGGVMRHDPENALTAELSELNRIISEARNNAESYAQRLNDYLCSNTNLFPEYYENQGADLYPHQRITIQGGWNI